MGRRIFIHHEGALGDLLLSLSAIQALGGPGDSIYLAGRGDVVDFLKRTGYINYGMRSGSQDLLPLFVGAPDRRIREFLSGFDRIYVFSADTSSCVAANIRLLFPGADVIRTIPPPESRVHVSDYRREQVTPKPESGISTSCLTIPQACQEEARVMLLARGYDFMRPIVAVHPGSGSRKKCWPLRNFEELIKNIRERVNCFLVIFSGPAEAGKMQGEIDDSLKGGEKNYLHISGCDLATVASLLSLCHLYIGNDSGITHLAASVMNGGIVAIFGPTDPVLWGPKADGAEIISSDLECAPCETNRSEGGFHRRSEECGIKCLSDITVRRVLERCETVSERIPRPDMSGRVCE